MNNIGFKADPSALQMERYKLPLAAGRGQTLRNNNHSSALVNKILYNISLSWLVCCLVTVAASVITHDFNHQKKKIPLKGRQCKALALGKLTFKRNWVHFRLAYMEPIWQQWGTPVLNMCTHAQYTFYRHEGQLSLCQALSLRPPTVFFCSTGGDFRWCVAHLFSQSVSQSLFLSLPSVGG